MMKHACHFSAEEVKVGGDHKFEALFPGRGDTIELARARPMPFSEDPA